jgi:heme exporter protein D
MPLVRRDRPRFAFTIPELYAVLALLVYGIGTIGFALFGAAFFFWFVLATIVTAPFVAVSVRRRRRRLQRLRAARRRARVSAYADPWLDWEEAA